ncbi:glycerophosphodiester phosphodiesterase family protein [Cytophagales bacterium LB-30]|uniref:Glycerophosphodiester phosphodiesterase family protein n=1 Tax=Shiella aurantiaca TaxID=3058365 RepID=A0ABT8F6V1_9BACT|nr:glycerophosphodiester phosphodiesterase family protein [Shiella aurantiaca]MDN4166180.1 glycerophosphodiester phosphodiesterase family protein [Shiella aurantiaca]
MKTTGYQYIYLFLPFFLLAGYSMAQTPTIDFQGHRGCRGLYPENSIEGMLHALRMGVNTLEMDVVISADEQVVVSHEPAFSEEISDFEAWLAQQPDSHSHNNIYQLPYETVRGIDCGSKVHPRFPEQKKLSTYKPLLVELIDSVETVIKREALSKVRYSIEIKSVEGQEGITQPDVARFSSLVYEVVSSKLPTQRVIIQSFDVRVLEYWHKTYPQYVLAYLVEEQPDAKEAMKKLSFVPEIYSPDYTLLTPESITWLQSLGCQIIPWTVNEAKDMQRLISWGVNGIITDYPNRIPMKY